MDLKFFECTKKKLKIQKYTDTCGQCLKLKGQIAHFELKHFCALKFLGNCLGLWEQVKMGLN